MTISGSLSNALSGLAASARAAEVVSSNVANSLTDGYGRREINLASKVVGGNGAGVQVQNVSRTVDAVAISERRLADASLGNSSVGLAFFEQLELVFGNPSDTNSLTGRLTQFEATLIEAASRPESEARLNSVLNASKQVTEIFNRSSEKIQNLRLTADQNIDREVGKLNTSLSQISEINFKIRSQLASGNDANSLMDQRQQLIDGISGIIPMRQVPREGGQIALFTTGGAVLLDGKPSVVEFSPVGLIVPEMVFGSSTLSGLSINGQPVLQISGGPLGGGSLAGHFSVRDDFAVTAQARLDGVARDLIERFADPSVDPTLSATDPGIFTDASLAFNALNEIGIASRISINSLIDPASSGELWRIRDGLNALSQGDVGNSSQIQSLIDALGVPKIPASGGFGAAARSASGLFSDLMSLTNADLRTLETQTSFASSQVYVFKSIELQAGVDSDYEMQQLLLIEQAYAANARVISTIDEMIQTIIGL